MILPTRWRWAALAGVPVIAGAVLYVTGLMHPIYEAHAMVSLTPETAGLVDDEVSPPRLAEMQNKISALQKKSASMVRLDHPHGSSSLRLSVEGVGSAQTHDAAQAAAQWVIKESLERQKAALLHSESEIEAQALALNTQIIKLSAERDAALTLLHHAAGHLQGRKNSPEAKRVNTISRQIVETQMQEMLLAQRGQLFLQHKMNLKSHWRLSRPADIPSYPLRIQGWPLGVGVMGLVFFGCFWFLKEKKEHTMTAAPTVLPFIPTELKVVTPERAAPEEAVATQDTALPDDPMTRQAAALSERWLELTKILYEPTLEPPQGIFERVTPLFAETMKFFVQGHDVMTRYLAQCSATPHDLPMHVSRTVLMVLLAAHEAEASTDHCIGMAMAALFHDVAMVPRTASMGWADIGSEVGRLSAVFLQKIPGLSPQVVSMAQDILIGMDEYPMNVWQNIPRSQSLESYAKLLRHTDRFEKVMQKQKERVARRPNQRAIG